MSSSCELPEAEITQSVIRTHSDVAQHAPSRAPSSGHRTWMQIAAATQNAQMHCSISPGLRREQHGWRARWRRETEKWAMRVTRARVCEVRATSGVKEDGVRTDVRRTCVCVCVLWWNGYGIERKRQLTAFGNWMRAHVSENELLCVWEYNWWLAVCVCSIRLSFRWHFVYSGIAENRETVISCAFVAQLLFMEFSFQFENTTKWNENYYTIIAAYNTHILWYSLSLESV